MMDRLTIFVAQYLIVLPVIVLVAVFFYLNREDRIKILIIVVSGGAVALLLTKLGAHFYSDPRPFIADHITPLFKGAADNGFPSDHTLLSSFIAFVVLVFNRRIGAALLILAAIIGWARVTAGVHHLPDVLGAFAISGIGLLAGIGAYRLYIKVYGE
jgi:undecaprenyl-diphosphatase